MSGFNLLPYLHANIDSTVAGVRKPDPEIFHIGCRALGLATTETLVIGDSLGNDIMPAASIGCHTALVCGRPWPDSSPVHYRPDISGTLDQIAAALI